MADVIQINVTAQDDASAVLEKIAAAFGDFSRVLTGIQPGSAALDTIARSIAGVADPTERARDALGRFVAQGIAPVADGAARAGAGMGELAKDTEPIAGAADRARDGLGRFTKEAQDGAPKVTAFGEVATGALRKIGEAAFDLAGKAVQGLAGFASTSLQVAADFEKSTATFASVAGGSLSQAGFALDDVKNKALELGAVTQFSAAEAQDAMINLAKGGVPIADIMGKATDATLGLAAAGDVDLANAADIVAKQLGVWADTGVDAAQVADLMAQAANASTVDVEELAGGLAAVGGVAKVSGVSFQDLNQTMALLAPGFSSASDAGTSFKTMLLAMQGKSDDAIGVMKNLGIITTDYAGIADDLGVSFDGSAASQAKLQKAINDTVTAQSHAIPGTKEWGKTMEAFLQDFQVNQFYDANGAMKDMGSVAEILKTSLAGLSEEQKTAALNTMFGTDAYRAAAFLAQAGGEGFAAMGASMTAAGTAAEQAATRSKTFQFAWDSLKGTIETLQIVIGSALLPLLTSLVNNAIIPAANAVLEFAQSGQISAATWSGLMTALDGILPGLGTVVNLIAGNIMPILASLAAMIVAVVVPAFWAWAFAAETGAVATALAMLPVIAPILAIGAAVGLLVAAWQGNWFGIQQITASVWASIQPYFVQLVDWFQAQLPVAIAALSALWSGMLLPALQATGAFIMGTIVPALVQIWTWLTTNIPAAFNATITAVTGFVASVQAGWGVAVAGVMNFAASVQAGWGVVIGSVMGFIASVQAGWGVVVSGAQAAWASVVTTVTGVWASLVTSVTSFIASVQAGWGVVVSGAQAAWAGLVAIVLGVIGVIVGQVMAFVTAVQGVWGAVVTAAAIAWNGLVGIVTPILANVAYVIQTLMLAAWNTVVFAAQAAWGLVYSVAIAPALDFIMGAIEGWIYILSTAWNQIVGAAQVAWSAVMTVVQPVLDTLSAAVTAFLAYVTTGWDQIVSAATLAWNAVLGVVQVVVAAVQLAVSTFLAGVALGWDVVVGAATTAWNAVSTAVSSAVATISSTVSSGLQSAAQIASSVWDAVAGAATSAWAGVVSAVTSAVDSVSSAVSSGLAAAAATASSVWTSVSTASSSAWAQVAAAVQSAVATVQGVIASGVAAVQSVWASGMAAVEQPTIAVWTTIRTTITTVVDSIKTAIQSGIDIVKTIMSGAWAVVVAAAENDFGRIPTIVSGVWEKVKASFSAGVAAIRTAAGALVNAAVEIGANIVSGVAKGIGNAGSVIADKLKSMASSALSAAKSALGIHSPSSVMAAQVGVQIPAGVAAGVAQATPKAASAMTDMAGKLVGLVSNATGAFAQLANIGAIPGGAVQRFSESMLTVVSMLDTINVATRGRMMASAMQITGGANKVLETITKGVDGFAKLATMGAVPARAMALFADALLQVVTTLDSVNLATRGRMMASAVQITGGAEKIVDLIGKGADAFAKLASIGQVSQSTVARFGDILFATIATLQSIALQYGGSGLTFTQIFADAAGKIVETIGKAVDGLNKLRDFVAPSVASFVALRDGLSNAVGYMVNLSGWFANIPLAAAVLFMESAGKIVAVIGSGVDGLKKLRDFVAPAEASFVAFRDSLANAVGYMTNLSRWFASSPVAAAATFAESASKIVGIIGSAIDNLAKLASIKRPAEDAVDTFGESAQLFVGRLTLFVSMFVAGVASFHSEAVAAAAAWADSAGKIVAVIGSGTAAFQTLANIKPLPEDAADTFGADIEMFLEKLTWFVAMFVGYSQDFAIESVQAAATFAESSAKIVGIIKPAIDGFAVLPTLVAPTWESVKAFGDAIFKFVGQLGMTTHYLDVDAVAIVAQFAESASKIVALIKPAIDGFAVLPTLVAPSWDSVTAFSDAIFKFVGQLGMTTHYLDVEATSLVAQFAEAASKIVGLIKPAVEGFAALSELRPVADQSVQTFVAMVNDLMVQLNAAASGFSIDALTAAGKFADAAGKAVGLLGKGVEGFYKVDSFAGISQDAIARFGEGLRLTVLEMQRLSTLFTADALAAASAFATAAEQSVEFMKKGVDGLKKLATLKDEVDLGANMDKFAIGIRKLVTTMIGLAATISTDMLTEANRMAVGLDVIITVLNGAQQAIGKLAETSTGLGLVQSHFTDGIAALLTSFKGQVFPVVEDIGAQIPIVFAGGITTGMPQATAAFNVLIASIGTALADMAQQVISPAGVIGTNIAIGIANGISSATPAIVTAVYAAVNAALSAARQTLGIASPSKVFDRLIGRQAGAGMVRGMQASTPLIAAAGRSMAQAAITGGVAGLPTPRTPAAAATPSSSRSVIINIQPGAFAITAAAGETEQAGDVMLDRFTKQVLDRLT